MSIWPFKSWRLKPVGFLDKGVLEMSLLLTVPEAMSLLNVGRTAIYRLITSGDLASIKIGASRRVPQSAIDSFIAERIRAAQIGQQSLCNTVRKVL